MIWKLSGKRRYQSADTIIIGTLQILVGAIISINATIVVSNSKLIAEIDMGLGWLFFLYAFLLSGAILEYIKNIH